ncbi:MAG: hypothetical protein MHMPM18_003366, partial [Marteilia pararefringens]
FLNNDIQRCFSAANSSPSLTPCQNEVRKREQSHTQPNHHRNSPRIIIIGGAQKKEGRIEISTVVQHLRPWTNGGYKARPHGTMRPRSLPDGQHEL